jgi:hypothetical protein
LVLALESIDRLDETYPLDITMAMVPGRSGSSDDTRFIFLIALALVPERSENAAFFSLLESD